jgi:hypothetical protein
MSADFSHYAGYPEPPPVPPRDLQPAPDVARPTCPRCQDGAYRVVASPTPIPSVHALCRCGCAWRVS